jgi:cytochrome c-type biogenesis protein CcmE
MKALFVKSSQKKKRIKFIIASTFLAVAALIFIISSFRDNIIFFYSPNELSNLKISNQKIIRVGGLVKEGSVIYSSGNLDFIITDFKEDLEIQYKGIKPDLFREKQGMIAKGFLDKENNIFIASEILTKHDEKYMPPEVAKKIAH